MEEYIRDSLLTGFGSAFVGIFIVFCLQLRSVLLGTIVMIPHLMPIVITLGIMGLTGIRLDSTTAMVASVAIGLADDDSIHFVSRVGQKLKGGVDMVTPLREALVEVGRALFYTSIALCAGFGVMLACLLVIERNVRKLGRAGMQSLTGGFKSSGGVRGFFGETGRAWRDRFRRDDS